MPQSYWEQWNSGAPQPQQGQGGLGDIGAMGQQAFEQYGSGADMFSAMMPSGFPTMDPGRFSEWMNSPYLNGSWGQVGSPRWMGVFGGGMQQPQQSGGGNQSYWEPMAQGAQQGVGQSYWEPYSGGQTTQQSNPSSARQRNVAALMGGGQRRR